jgi:hypothetical protein
MYVTLTVGQRARRSCGDAKNMKPIFSNLTCFIKNFLNVALLGRFAKVMLQ